MDITDRNKLSHSEVESFVLCERRHYYGYGLELQSKKPSQALIRGVAGHAALEAYYKALQSGEKRISELKAIASNAAVMEILKYSLEDMTLVTELAKIIPAYIDRYYDKDKDLEILAVEEGFKIPVSDDYYIMMYVDLIARGWEGIEVRDHKFVYNFYAPVQAALNPQLPKYASALRTAGWTIDKAYYNQIRYRVTADQKDNPNAMFQMLEVPLNDARIERTEMEQIAAAQRIRKLKEMPINEWEKSVLRVSNDMVCERCPFREICAMEMNGKDIELAVDMGFKHKEKRA